MHPSPDPCLRYSQNFIRDPKLVEYLLDRSSIQGADLVYEIGPGTGVITERLAGRCRRVVAIEKDRELVAYLRRRFRTRPNIAIHAADFLRFPLSPAPFKVFASIPFAATADIVTRLTAYRAPPLDSYLIVQREAAERFLGSPRGTLYAALLYPWFAARVIHRFQPRDFRPMPGVESVLLQLEKRPQALVSETDRQFFRDFLTCTFTTPRPTIHRALRACLGRPLADHLARMARLDPAATPSMAPGTLWLLLFEHLKDAGGVSARQRVAGAEQRLRRQQLELRKRHRTNTAISSRQAPLLPLQGHGAANSARRCCRNRRSAAFWQSSSARV
jgi:23S rRNA (adenine-N6)-dimethyltransferase